MKLKKALLYIISVFSCIGFHGLADDTVDFKEGLEDEVLLDLDSVRLIVQNDTEKKAYATSLVNSDSMSFSGSLALRTYFSNDDEPNLAVVDSRILSHPSSKTFFSPGWNFGSSIFCNGSVAFDDGFTCAGIGIDFFAAPFDSRVNLSLYNAFFGFKTPTSRTLYVALDVGRHRMSDLSESPVQYDSIFDGVFIRYGVNSASGFKANAGFGAFAIDVSNGHFGELLDLNVDYNGLYINYSLINWKLLSGEYREEDKVVLVPLGSNVSFTNIANIDPVNVSYAYTNSQISAGVNVTDILFGMDLSIYAGAVVNHGSLYNYQESPYNKGYFVGTLLGNKSSKDGGGLPSLLVQFFYIEPLSIKESDYALGSKFVNTVSRGVRFYDTGNPFLSNVNVMGPRAVLSVFPSDNVKMKVDVSYVMPVVGSVPNKFRTGIDLAYSF